MYVVCKKIEEPSISMETGYGQAGRAGFMTPDPSFSNTYLRRI